MTKLCPRGKAAAKRKFKVYPSAYANAYASKICAGKIKDPSGVKRKDFKGPKPMNEGGMAKDKEMKKRIAERAVRAAKATKLGKVAAGVAAAGLTAKAYLNKKLEEARAKRKVQKKMGGGMTAGSMSGMGRLQKARMMNKGGGADTGKAGERTSKREVARYKMKRVLRGDIEVKKMGGLTSELNNPAKGYTKGGMADYYKDLM